MSAIPIIIYADDDENDRFLLRRAFSKIGHEVEIVEAANGLELLATLAQLRPQLVLLDVKMPVMGGHEALSKIRLNPALVDLPVLMLSSSFHEKDRETARGNGALGYFTKPTSAQELTLLAERIWREAIEKTPSSWLSNTTSPESLRRS